ncbi:MAG: pilus assembly protein N-terminal domain-containing protein [Deltaproteobacteria bacterium]|nr:pilus assembly protein N-terminal domain-containing protein [Deltaproteobacteria bacterium]
MRGLVGSTKLLAVAALLALPAVASAQDSNNTIALGVGSQKVISVSNVAKIAVGDPNVADVKPVGSNQILVVGMAEGRTTLIIFRTSGQRLTYLISVRKQDPNEVIGEIRKLLGDREGITVRMVGDRIYLDGQAYTAEDNERVTQITQLYPNVKSFVKVAPNAKKLVANNLNAALQKAGLKNVQANVVGTTIFLEGSVESQQDLSKAELITKAIGEHVENLLTVGIKRMVLTEVQLVEIRRSNTDHLGIKWPTDIAGSTAYSFVLGNQNIIPGPGQFTGQFNTTTGASSDFAFSLSLSDGYARVLAQPKLVCASGETAEFLAGGQVPIPMITANQFAVEFKDYGVILKIKPTADRNGNIQTLIETEASEIDRSVSVAIGANISVPGFRTRKVKTNVTVRHGETIVLSGVFQNDEEKDVSKLPGPGNIPLIGEFFKNRTFQGSKRELVIFVTPRIVNPDTERVQKIIEDIKNRYKQARDEVTFSIFD